MLRAAAFVAHSSRRRGAGVPHMLLRDCPSGAYSMSRTTNDVSPAARARSHAQISVRAEHTGKAFRDSAFIDTTLWKHLLPCCHCHQSTCRHIYIQLGEVKVVQTYGLRRLSILIFVRGVRMDVSAWPRFTLYKVKYSVWKKGEPVALSKRRSRNPVKLSTNPPFYRSSR